jgi:hypothetical protein
VGFEGVRHCSFCKTIIVAKDKEMKTGCKLAESSYERYGSKRGDFAAADDDDIDSELILLMGFPNFNFMSE